MKYVYLRFQSAFMSPISVRMLIDFKFKFLSFSDLFHVPTIIDDIEGPSELVQLLLET